MSKFFLHAKQHSVRATTYQAAVLTKPTNYMTCDKPVWCKWYIASHSWFHQVRVMTLKAVASDTESDRMIAKLIAIQLIESFSIVQFKGQNTWSMTI